MSDPLGQAGPVSLRAMLPEDEQEVLRLLSRTLGWKDDERHRDLLAWKHQLNPFGPSPAWVAEDEQGIAGFRTMMRWEFLVGGSPVRAARAVDTATDPRCRGRGIFRALTMEAIRDLQAERTAWVFNTPNTQSAPGYLSMGWEPVGRLPVSVRPASVGVIPGLLAARQPSDLWSAPASAGEMASDVLADEAAIDRLLSANDAEPAGARTVRTRRSAQYMMWRFGLCPVGYRALPAPGGPEKGFILFRVRRRGPRTEVLIADMLLADPHDSSIRRRLWKSVTELTGADYAVGLGVSRSAGRLRLPRLGPLLTWRRLDWKDARPALGQWKLSSGDIELF